MPDVPFARIAERGAFFDLSFCRDPNRDAEARMLEEWRPTTSETAPEAPERATDLLEAGADERGSLCRTHGAGAEHAYGKSGTGYRGSSKKSVPSVGDPKVSSMRPTALGDASSSARPTGIRPRIYLNNFLFHEGKAYVIDFEVRGWGYYLFDLSVTLSSLEGCVEHSAPMQAALVEGYQRERPLPEGLWRYLETFMAMRVVRRVNMALGREDPTRREWGPRFLLGSVEGLKEFVASEGEAGQTGFVSPW